MRKLVSLAVSVPFLIAASACGDDSSSADPTPRSTRSAPTTANATKAKTTVKVTRTRYGRILVDGNGRALYLFTREGGSRPRCYGACAQAWPVFYARGDVRAGAGARSGLVGTTRRRDGRRQVTYRGHPLYYYVTDRKPGQVTCQNVVEYGGTWLVVAPSGNAIR